MFEADASKLEHGIDDAKKKTDGLTHSLKASDQVANKLGSSIKEMVATAGGALLAGFTAKAIYDGIQGAADYADRIGKVSDALNVNVTDLSAWSDAVEMAGGNGESFISAASELQAKLTEISVKGTSDALVFFQQLGISMTDANGKAKDVMTMLPELAGAFEKMDKTQSMGIGKRLGLDEGTIMLLQQGKKAVEEQIAQRKELGTITKEEAKVAADYHDSISRLQYSFRSLFATIGLSVLPAMQWLMDGMTKMVSFFKKHSDFMVGLFIALGSAIAVYVVPPLLSAAAASIAAFAPFLLIGAIIAAAAAAFALLYDDVMNFIDGNDSLIGQIVEKYPMVGDIVKGLAAPFMLLYDVAKAVFGFLVDLIDNPAQAWDNFVNAVVEGISKLSNMFPDFFGMISDGAEKIAGVIGAVKDFFGLGGDVTVAKSVVAGANASPLNGVTSAAITNSATKSTSVSVGKVEVHTQATDAEGISRSIGSTLSDEVKRATSQYDDGIIG